MRIYAFSDARLGLVATAKSADFVMFRHTPRPLKGVQLMTMRYVGEQGLGLSEEQ